MLTCDYCNKKLPRPEYIKWKMHHQEDELANYGITAVGMYCCTKCELLDTNEARRERLALSTAMRGVLASVFGSVHFGTDRYVGNAESPFNEPVDMMYLGGEYDFHKYYRKG